MTSPPPPPPVEVPDAGFTRPSTFPCAVVRRTTAAFPPATAVAALPVSVFVPWVTEHGPHSFPRRAPAPVAPVWSSAAETVVAGLRLNFQASVPLAALALRVPENEPETPEPFRAAETL